MGDWTACCIVHYHIVVKALIKIRNVWQSLAYSPLGAVVAH